MDLRARIHALYENPLDGAAIERASFAAIDAVAGQWPFPADQWEVVRRLIHTTADLTLGDVVRFTPTAIPSAVKALREGAEVITDSNMIRAGISIPRLQAACARYTPQNIRCAVADRDVAKAAREAGLPRAIFSLRKASPALDGGIILFGNSPVGLLELNRLIIEEGVRPALVVGMPVGFVHVLESKEELMELPVPWIVITGRRGGSPLAVATLHALCTLARRV